MAAPLLLLRTKGCVRTAVSGSRTCQRLESRHIPLHTLDTQLPKQSYDAMTVEAIQNGAAVSPALSKPDAAIRPLYTSKRIQSLEGLRALAISLVFWVHYHALFMSKLPASSWIRHASDLCAAFGNAGVDLFFVLSGYLIYRSVMQTGSSYSRFIKRRFQRIYPVFGVVLCVYIVICLTLPVSDKIPTGASRAAVYLLANALFLPGICRIPPLITVAWSLSYEMAFYIILPLFVAFFRLRARHWKTRVGCFGALAVVAFGLSIAHPTEYIRGVLFIPGIILYEISEHANFRNYINRGLEVLTILCFCAAILPVGLLQRSATSLNFLPMYPHLEIYRVLLVGPLFFALVLYSLTFNGILSRTFANPFLGFLGRISYSYYLIHGLILHFLSFLIASVLHFRWVSAWALSSFAIAAFLCCIAGASLLFWGVEWPFSLKNSTR